jgi:hypothetical protein
LGIRRGNGVIGVPSSPRSFLWGSDGGGGGIHRDVRMPLCTRFNLTPIGVGMQRREAANRPGSSPGPARALPAALAERPPHRHLGLRPAASRQSPALGSFERTPEPGPLSSSGIARILRSYGPLRLLPNPHPGDALPDIGGPNRSPVLPVTACAYVLRPIPRRAGRPSSVGCRVVLGGLRPRRGDSALA